MHIGPDTLTREVALALPTSLGLFEAWGIDYCCGGSRPLEEAAARAGVALTDVLVELSRLQSQPQLRDWTQATPEELIHYILDKHHAFTRTAVDSLRTALTKVLLAHGEHHPWLAEFVDLAESMFDDLDAHMEQEEVTLFPGILALSQGRDQGIDHATLEASLFQVEQDHQEVGANLRQLRALADGYRPPVDACTTFRALLAGFDDLEKDLHRHIHLENNLLQPRLRVLLGC